MPPDIPLPERYSTGKPTPPDASLEPSAPAVAAPPSVTPAPPKPSGSPPAKAESAPPKPPAPVLKSEILPPPNRRPQHRRPNQRRCHVQPRRHRRARQRRRNVGPRHQRVHRQHRRKRLRVSPSHPERRQKRHVSQKYSLGAACPKYHRFLLRQQCRRYRWGLNVRNSRPNRNLPWCSAVLRSVRRLGNQQAMRSRHSLNTLRV